ncbi:HAD-IIIA family hydrolase, partial [Mycobacterium sp. 1245852.3]|uniref:HAD-IIIA family hydrolase n=2 Tax=Mycobacterium TaxID=1763 RepID=UPI000AFD1C64
EPGCFTTIQQRLHQLLANDGARLDAVYHCPHAANSCECRKPLAGMLVRAAQEHGFELAESVMIGDGDTDMMAGRTAGTATILLRTGGHRTVDADFVVDDLAGAVQLVLSARASL